MSAQETLSSGLFFFDPKSAIPEQCRGLLDSEIGDYEVVSSSGEIISIRFWRPEKPRDWWLSLYKRLVSSGCRPYARNKGAMTYMNLVLVPKEKGGVLKALGLALITLVTVYLSGLYLYQEFVGLPGVHESLYSGPILYLVGLLGPLLIHELGHWTMMRRYETPSSLPYLIPAPPLQLGFIGTFGAVINLRWIPPIADALAVIGVMGPLLGWIAAIPVTALGMHLSVTVPSSAVPEAGGLTVAPLSFMILAYLYGPQAGIGEVVVLHPLAFAGYILFLVTFLNLIPIGQLDGGHIVRASIGDAGHRLVSKGFLILLFVMGMFEPFLGAFALLALLLYMISRGRHPGPAMPVEKLSSWGQLAVVVYAFLLVLNFPIPIG